MDTQKEIVQITVSNTVGTAKDNAKESIINLINVVNMGYSPDISAYYVYLYIMLISMA